MRVMCAAVILLTIVSYRGIWNADWVYEDSNAVSANPAVLGTAPIAVDRARWMSALSHRLVYQVSTGPRLSHVVNLGLHLVNGALVFAIAGAFLTPAGALLTAALFLLHPVQTEAVAYVASRSELLATCFALIAFWRSLSADRWFKHAVVWLCVGLAAGAKESAAVVVPLIAVADVFRGKHMSRWWYACLLAPVLAMAYSVVQFDYLSRSDLNQLQYAATQATAVWRYLGIVFVPIGQSVDHDFDLIPWGIRWLALFGIWSLAMIPLFGAMTTFNGDTKLLGRIWDEMPTARLMGFGVTWLLIVMAPRFIMRIPEPLSEHQLYLGFIGVAFALAAIVSPFLSSEESYARAQESC